MAALVVQTITTAGLEVSLDAADVAGDTFINNEKTYFQVINGSGSPITVTFNSLSDCNQGFDHDVVVTVGASEDHLIGPFPANRFNTSASLVGVSYSDITTVTVGAISL
jgi:hypothetical protein